MLEALYEQAKAQMDLYDEQVSRAAIRAPFDGVVVKGDLSQSLGSAVKRGDVLFELTPLEVAQAYTLFVNRGAVRPLTAVRRIETDTGELRPRDAVRALEEAAVEPFADLRAGLEATGMKQERRALRVRVHDLQWQWPAADELELRFALAPGAYTTGLLDELGAVTDASGGR